MHTVCGFHFFSRQTSSHFPTSSCQLCRVLQALEPSCVVFFESGVHCFLLVGIDWKFFRPKIISSLVSGLISCEYMDDGSWSACCDRRSHSIFVLFLIWLVGSFRIKLKGNGSHQAQVAAQENRVFIYFKICCTVWPPVVNPFSVFFVIVLLDLGALDQMIGWHPFDRPPSISQFWLCAQFEWFSNDTLPSSLTPFQESALDFEVETDKFFIPTAVSCSPFDRDGERLVRRQGFLKCYVSFFSHLSRRVVCRIWPWFCLIVFSILGLFP